MGIISFIAPEAWEEEYEDRETFQASQEHQEAAEPFRHKGEMGIAAEAAAGTHAGTVAGNAAEDGTEGLGGVDTADQQQQQSHQDGDGIDDKDHHHVGDDAFRHRLAIEPHRVVGMGVQPVDQRVVHIAEKDQHTHDLDAAGSGTGHSAAGGEDQEEEQQGGPPQVGVGHHAAGGGQHAGGLHHPEAKGVGPGGAVMEMQDGDGKSDGEEQQRQIEAELIQLVLYLTPTEGYDIVQQREVDAADEHGGGQEVLLQGREARHAVGIDGETASGDIGEGEVDRLPHRHARQDKEHDEEGGEGKIDREGLPHHGTHGGGGLACVVGTAGFGGIQAVFVQPQRGHHGEDQQDDAETAQPLGDAAPEQYGGGQRLDIGEDGGTCGGESRHGLEEGVGQGTAAAGGEEGERSEKGHDTPDQRHGDIRDAAVDSGTGLRQQQQQQESHQQGRPGGEQHGECRPVMEKDGGDETQKHGDALPYQRDS